MKIILIMCLFSLAIGEDKLKTEKNNFNKQESQRSSNNSAKPSLSGDCFYHGPRELKLVALTYDDGPNRRFTPRLLELLKREQVPATFFLLGEQVKNYPSEAKQIAELGFEIGNHTFTHKNLTKLTREEIYNEITSTQEIINKTTDIMPKIMRPPYGVFNQTVIEVTRELGLSIIMWQLDTDDYRQNVIKEQIVASVLKNVKGGDIILMHDRNNKTLEATADIIPALRRRGFRFVTVSELLRAQKMVTEYKTLSRSPSYSVLLKSLPEIFFPAIPGK
ncbi:MAG: polysaccharide deacetylase family protein [Candidatus Sumerlaeia bacterium]|nr:polysaccharide deacetylase family protein [Candidatus Sumerlaeia bacterium]